MLEGRKLGLGELLLTEQLPLLAIEKTFEGEVLP
jgi:hypothetical protein